MNDKLKKIIEEGLDIAEGEDFGNTHSREHAIKHFTDFILKLQSETRERTLEEIEEIVRQRELAINPVKEILTKLEELKNE